MVRGRKPKPAPLKALAGNPGKRKARGTVQPDPSLPDCPAHLSKEAKKYWSQYAEELNRLGLLTQVDAPGFAELCTAMAQSVMAQEKLEEMGLVLETYYEGEDGELYLAGIKRNPWQMVWKQANEVILKTLAEFGMTPSSRTRVGDQKKAKTKAKNPLQMWLVKNSPAKKKA